MEGNDIYARFSVCSYNNRYAFVIGGEWYPCLEVFRIDLATNTWEALPDLDKDADGPSSCIQSNTLYVFDERAYIQKITLEETTGLNIMSSWEVIEL